MNSLSVVKMKLGSPMIIFASRIIMSHRRRYYWGMAMMCKSFSGYPKLQTASDSSRMMINPTHNHCAI